MSNELQMINDDLDNMLTAMQSGDVDAIMEMTGQADSDNKPKLGLPRLTINYDTETDEGVQLRRGSWRIWNGSAVTYSDKVTFAHCCVPTNGLCGTKKKASSLASLYKTKLAGDFPDTAGGNKCGRLSKQEEEAFGADDPRTL
ncbi:MAG: hypothetical protein CM15mV47_180 [uncultured marine virus]|nr:MAG: hypothetical protein CM15mV47_180 [uncultured marine virus]